MTTEQTQSDSLSPVAKQASQLAAFFVIMAIGLIIVGGIHLFSIVNSGFTSIALADTVYHFTLGIMVFLCSRLLKKRNPLVIYLMGAVGIIAVLYGFLMGRGFNFVMVIIAGFFVWQLSKLTKAEEMNPPGKSIDELDQD